VAATWVLASARAKVTAIVVPDPFPSERMLAHGLHARNPLRQFEFRGSTVVAAMSASRW